jgi:hypothetical protein
MMSSAYWMRRNEFVAAEGEGRRGMSAIPKPRPKLLDKREASARKLALEIAENKRVKARSQGFCEAVILDRGGGQRRCHRRAGHVHHLVSGIGRRNVGVSILAEHKLHVCDQHHEEIHGHVLKPVNEQERYDAATVRYERIK